MLVRLRPRPRPTVLPTGEGTATLGSTGAHARVACAGAAYTYMCKKKSGAKPAGTWLRACVRVRKCEWSERLHTCMSVRACAYVRTRARCRTARLCVSVRACMPACVCSFVRVCVHACVRLCVVMGDGYADAAAIADAPATADGEADVRKQPVTTAYPRHGGPVESAWLCVCLFALLRVRFLFWLSRCIKVCMRVCVRLHGVCV